MVEEMQFQHVARIQYVALNCMTAGAGGSGGSRKGVYTGWVGEIVEYPIAGPGQLARKCNDAYVQSVHSLVSRMA